MASLSATPVTANKDNTAIGGEDKTPQQEETKAVEFEYTNTNEMEELGSSNAFAEFMTIF